MDIEKLKKIGLSEREAKVYVCLLQLGEASVSEVAKKADINRSLLYDFLDALSKKGLVTYIIKNNVRFYRPAEPTKIRDLLKEREKVYSSILPELLKIYSPRLNKPIIEVLVGKEGIKTILNDVLNLKKDWDCFNVPGKGPEVLGAMVHAFESERQKLGINLRAIFVSTDAGIKRAKDFMKMKCTHVKFTEQKYESPASNWIYDNRLVLIFWKKDEPFAIRIIDKELADSYRNHFNIMWKHAIELK